VGKEDSRGTKNITRVPLFMDEPSSLKGALSHPVLCKTKKQHLRPQDSNKNTIIHWRPLIHSTDSPPPIPSIYPCLLHPNLAAFPFTSTSQYHLNLQTKYTSKKSESQLHPRNTSSHRVRIPFLHKALTFHLSQSFTPSAEQWNKGKDKDFRQRFGV